MMDFQDRELKSWRRKMLDEVEMFCSSNILSSVPRKFSSRIWLAVLSSFAVATIVGSFILHENCQWLSGMLGNVAAGLIASILVLLYTVYKEKNISYYESLLSSFDTILNALGNAFIDLYLIQRTLRKGSNPLINNYYGFTLKVYIAHKALLDVYRQIKGADKLNCPRLLQDADLLQHEQAVENYQHNVAHECEVGSDNRLDEFDATYDDILVMEEELMRSLQYYREQIQKNIYAMKYGKK